MFSVGNLARCFSRLFALILPVAHLLKMTNCQVLFLWYSRDSENRWFSCRLLFRWIKMWPTRYNSPSKTRWCLGRFLRLVVDVWLNWHCHASDWTILSLSFSLTIKLQMLLLTKLHSICRTLIKKIFYEKVFMVEWVCQLAKDTGKMTLFKGTGKVKHRHDRGEVFSCPNKTQTVGKDHLKWTSYRQKFIHSKKQND